MIKRAMKKSGVMAMAFMLSLSSIAMTAQAAVVPRTMVRSSQDDIMPIWDYVILIVGDITISDSGWTDVFVDVGCDREVNKLQVKIELQRLENSSWKTVKTWSVSANDSVLTAEKSTGVYKGYSYRLKVTVKAYKDGTFLEQVTETFDYGFYN